MRPEPTNRSLGGEKRTDSTTVDEIQDGSKAWWNARPMDYDWHGQNPFPRGSSEWFAQIDREFLHAARLFATDERPFDRIMPLDALAGKRVLEIGCGMGLHTETMVRAGARLTAIDLTQTAVDVTRQRLALKGLQAEVLVCDAERIQFADKTFDFVWSWGVIHHSARTGLVVRQIARLLRPDGECRIMVYNREGASARTAIVLDHILKGGFLRHSADETLFRGTDGFSARYYVKEQFEDLFRTFFEEVSTEICGQDADVLPLPRQLRNPLLALIPESYQRAAQAKRGAFLFLTAKRPT